MRKLVAFLLIAELSIPLGWVRAASGATGLSLSQDIVGAAPGSEYVSGNYPGAILMPVNLWGAIGKPGIHHVPTRTDLVTLLALAGGTLADAELDSVVIKRRSGKEDIILKIDAEDVLTEAGVQSPILEANDIIIIPRERPVISSNVVTILGFASSIIGITLAGFALSGQLGK